MDGSRTSKLVQSMSELHKEGLQLVFPPNPQSASQVFISVQPRHTNNIADGTKTVEFRRRFPCDSRMKDADI